MPGQSDIAQSGTGNSDTRNSDAGQSNLEREIDGLADLPRSDLVARWQSIFGCLPPRGVKRGLLELAVAWHLQTRHFGGLSSSVKRRLKKLTIQQQAVLLQSANAREGTSSSGLTDQSLPSTLAKPPAASRLSIGTRLVREWHGRTHHVDVIEGGFLFEGKTHASLSAIARKITGAHWSGPRFFGLCSLQGDRVGS